MSEVLAPLRPSASSEVSTQAPAKTISDRLSQELVIALVGPVGSGVTTATKYIAEIMEQDFGYKVATPIKISKIIRSEATRVGLTSPDAHSLSRRINELQDIGNKLREKYGPNYLAEKAIESIVKSRREDGGYTEKGVQLPGRRAFLIDSLKNMEELQLLRQIYGPTLCVIGIFAPDEMRRRRLIDKGADRHEVDAVIRRDQGEPATFGQMTRKVFVQADFFICNDSLERELRARISRYLHIIFSTAVHTPTRAESAMYEANAAALNSACMSRQIGATIVSASGELIAIGWNDVPRFGGGLYREDDRSVVVAGKDKLQDRDHRCFKWGGKVCHNETKRNDILDGIMDKLISAKVVDATKSREEVRGLLKGTAIDSLTEFSRAVHAEMEAILAVAREGKHSLVGATIYTTTYPCHNCARHIVAAGITSVIYIEPYAKSLATELHEDSITEDPEDQGRVIFRQYDGVAPSNFLRLFNGGPDRKKDGRLWRPDAKSAHPLFQIPLDGPAEFEAKVIADLVEKEQPPGSSNDSPGGGDGGGQERSLESAAGSKSAPPQG